MKRPFLVFVEQAAACTPDQGFRDRTMARNSNGVENGYQLPFERKINPLQKQIGELEAAQVESGRDYSAEIRRLRAEGPICCCAIWKQG